MRQRVEGLIDQQCSLLKDTMSVLRYKPDMKLNPTVETMQATFHGWHRIEVDMGLTDAYEFTNLKLKNFYDSKVSVEYCQIFSVDQLVICEFYPPSYS